MTRRRSIAGLIVSLALLAASCGSASPVATPEPTVPDPTSVPQTPSSSATGAELSPDPASRRVVDTTVVVGEVMVRTQRIDVADPAITILFLHGAAFTSQTWVDNSILAEVAVGGTRGIAVDLPGFGDTPRSDLEEPEFLVALVDALGLDPAFTVIISPSMSGVFALGALDAGLLDDLAGFVGVAPSGSGRFSNRGELVPVPALAVWGDGDGSDPAGAAAELASAFVESSTVVIPDAGHAAYQQQPEAFTESLVKFVAGLPPCVTGACVP